MTAAAQAAANQATDNDDVTDDTSTEDTAAADQGDDTTNGAGDDGEVDWEAKAKELEAKFEAQQRINRNLERRTRKDKALIDELKGVKPATSTKDGAKPDEGKPGADVDVDKIRADALEQAKKEAQQEALKERVLDKIEAKAKDFADPVDAVAMLMREHEADDFIDDGKVDVVAIQDALKELLEKKPYLAAAAQGGKQRFQGSAEGGAKSQRPQRPQSLHEAVARRYNAST
jgi:hypothetical protein